MRSIIIHSNQIRIYIFLIIIAMIFAPFTQLRMGNIGITEICLMLFLIKVFLSRDMKFNLRNSDNFIFTKFWLIFLLLSFLGMGYNYIVLGHVSGTISSMIFDTMSYILVGLVCFSIEVVIYNYEKVDLWSILKKIYIYSSSILLVLFVFSQFTNSIFGYQIVYYNFFRPFATNIHHVSMAIAPLPFLGVRVLVLEKKLVNKLFILVLIISNFITANSTGSLKVTLGFIVGLIVFIYFIINNKIPNIKFRILILLAVTVITLAFLSVYSSQVMKYAEDFFTTEDLSGAREALYTSSVYKSLQSPFVGYGPGPHAEFRGDSYYDAHQSFLTVALQAGLFALIVYMFLHYKIFKSCIKDPYILGAYIGVLLYALGGDILRRLPMWIFLVLFYYYCLNKAKTIGR